MNKILLAAALLAVAASATADGVRRGSERLDTRRLTETRAETRGVAREATVLDARRLSELSVQLPGAPTSPTTDAGAADDPFAPAETLVGGKVRLQPVRDELPGRRIVPAGLRARFVVDDPRAQLGMTWNQYFSRTRPAFRLQLVQDLEHGDGQDWRLVDDITVLPHVVDASAALDHIRTISRMDGMTYVPATGDLLTRE